MTDSSRWAVPTPFTAAAGTTPDTDAAALSALLWTERELLEDLLFRLAEQQHLLAAGEVRWLAKADDDVRAAVEAVRAHEIVRAAEVDMLTRRYSLSPETALEGLAEHAPEPWPSILHDHRDVLRELTLEIEATTAQSKRLAQAGETATRNALEAVLRPGSSEDPVTRTTTFGASAYLLDRRA